MEDGWSFKACTIGGNKNILIFKKMFLSGCPNIHGVHNHTSDIVHSILTDNCNEEDADDWLVTKEATEGADNIESQIIINLGCSKKIKGLRMKNIKAESGGTKDFSVFTSESPEGPWKLILTDKLKEEETVGCASMQIFDKLE